MNELARRLARPHLLRAAAAALLALGGLILASHQIGSSGDLIDLFGEETKTRALLAAGGVALFLTAGVYAVKASTWGIERAVDHRLGEARGAPLSLVVSIVGYLTILIPALSLLGVDLGGLLLSGALAGIVLGIAAQQTLGNFIAGVVLLVIRPFNVGEHVVMRSGPLGGEYEGRVTDMGFFHTDMVTERGPVKLPNAGVLASAIGPGAKAPQEADVQVDEEGQASGGPKQ